MPTTGEITIRMWDVRLIVRKKGEKKAARRRRKWGPRLKIKKNRGEKRMATRRSIIGVDRKGGDKKERRQKKVKPYE